MPSARFILCFISIALCALISVTPERCFSDAMLHPLLASNSAGTCFNNDVPDSQICYPTRCYHLFTINNSTGALVPTPKNPGDAQTYPKFSCTVATRAVYNGLAANTHPAAMCKYALCTCTTGGASCEPGKLADCWKHTCS